MKQVLREEDNCEPHSNDIVHVNHAKNLSIAHQMVQPVQRPTCIRVTDYHRFSYHLHEKLTNSLPFLGIHCRLQLMLVHCSNRYIYFCFRIFCKKILRNLWKNIIYTYALALEIPRNINVCSGVFSGSEKLCVGGFLRGGVDGIFLIFIYIL